MSQKAVYELLKELGGRATSREISRLAKERYPIYTLHLYVTNRLHKLERNGIVKQDKEGYWEIIDEYPG